MHLIILSPSRMQIVFKIITHLGLGDRSWFCHIRASFACKGLILRDYLSSRIFLIIQGLMYSVRSLKKCRFVFGMWFFFVLHSVWHWIPLCVQHFGAELFCCNYNFNFAMFGRCIVYCFNSGLLWKRSTFGGTYVFIYSVIKWNGM